MVKAGLNRDRVIQIALELASEGHRVTLGKVAAKAGVKTPSLYKHVASAAELDSLVAERALVRFSEWIRSSLQEASGEKAARATLEAMRSFAARDRVHYQLIPVQPGNDERLKPIGDALLVDIANAIGYHDVKHPEALHALRLLRSAAEGFIRLEMAGGFGEPADVEESWERLVTVMSRSVLPVEGSS